MREKQDLRQRFPDHGHYDNRRQSPVVEMPVEIIWHPSVMMGLRVLIISRRWRLMGRSRVRIGASKRQDGCGLAMMVIFPVVVGRGRKTQMHVRRTPGLVPMAERAKPRR